MNLAAETHRSRQRLAALSIGTDEYTCDIRPPDRRQRCIGEPALIAGTRESCAYTDDPRLRNACPGQCPDSGRTIPKQIQRDRRDIRMTLRRAEGLEVSRDEHCQTPPRKVECIREHRLEHRRELARRGRDHAQHLGGRGLLLQQFAQLR